ncbi:DUF6429 family protein [Pseudomonas cichorii]
MSGATIMKYDEKLMSRLHDHGFISNPVNRNKSIWLTAKVGSEVASKLPPSK